MKKFILFVVLLFSVSCSTHYVKVNKEQLIFYLRVKKAQEVGFYSDIDGFKKHMAEQIKKDLWVVTINKPISKELKYFYIIDGKTFIPNCKLKEKDDFGGENCIYKTEW